MRNKGQDEKELVNQFRYVECWKCGEWYHIRYDECGRCGEPKVEDDDGEVLPLLYEEVDK